MINRARSSTVAPTEVAPRGFCRADNRWSVVDGAKTEENRTKQKKERKVGKVEGERARERHVERGERNREVEGRETERMGRQVGEGGRWRWRWRGGRRREGEVEGGGSGGGPGEGEGEGVGYG